MTEYFILQLPFLKLPSLILFFIIYKKYTVRIVIVLVWIYCSPIHFRKSKDWLYLKIINITELKIPTVASYVEYIFYFP